MPSPFYLVGPTGVGKSALAVEIASRCGAEIIGADAFQVYEGLDILTAKPTAEQRRRIRHHLIGTLPLREEYSVARYMDDAQRCLADLAARKVAALVVGGSGLYVRALTHGLSPLPPPRPELRIELESWDIPALQARLQAADQRALETIDANNKRRLIRAIEICEQTGQPLAATRALRQRQGGEGKSSGLFLTRDRPTLHARIGRRVAAMVADGVIEEVRRHDAMPFSSTSGQIIGLRELRAHQQGEIKLLDCLHIITIRTRQYAKRQETWFRNKSDFPPVALVDDNDEAVINRVVESILRG